MPTTFILEIKGLGQEGERPPFGNPKGFLLWTLQVEQG